jgi:hypothetical protein
MTEAAALPAWSPQRVKLSEDGAVASRPYPLLSPAGKRMMVVHVFH